ncbi:MAG: hypothetical protein KF753_01675 [Caldilineaceae bacterium]|nr:hypothetical protein [Caldilineaceae bacterium]
MQVEIDQSGKIGNTGQDTVVAYSNADSFCVLIPRQVKRECLRYLRSQGVAVNTIYYRMFGIGLFYLLRERIDKIDLTLIDVEYPGHEAAIRRYLLNLLRRDRIVVQPDKIRFSFIGKKSNAHKLGLETFQGKRRADVTLTAGDILKQFGEK